MECEEGPLVNLMQSLIISCEGIGSSPIRTLFWGEGDSLKCMCACNRRTTETGTDAEKMEGGMSDRQSNGASA